MTDTTTTPSQQFFDTKSSIGFDVLTLKAQLRGAFALLSGMEEYCESDDLCDVGFALIDAEKRLNEINGRIDAMRFDEGDQNGQAA